MIELKLNRKIARVNCIIGEKYIHYIHLGALDDSKGGL